MHTFCKPIKSFVFLCDAMNNVPHAVNLVGLRNIQCIAKVVGILDSLFIRHTLICRAGTLKVTSISQSDLATHCSFCSATSKWLHSLNEGH